MQTLKKYWFPLAMVAVAVIMIIGWLVRPPVDNPSSDEFNQPLTTTTSNPNNNSMTDQTNQTAQPVQPAQKPAATDQLKVEVLAPGTGSEVSQVGQTITVNYTGKLTNGTVFDSSIGRQPFSFTLGGGQVIKGWDQGLVGLKAGEKVRLTIPAALAYGDQAVGSIPANSTLIFEVDVISFK